MSEVPVSVPVILVLSVKQELIFFLVIEQEMHSPSS